MNITPLILAAISVCSRHHEPLSVRYAAGYEDCAVLDDFSKPRRNADEIQDRIDKDTLHRAIEAIKNYKP